MTNKITRILRKISADSSTDVTTYPNGSLGKSGKPAGVAGYKFYRHFSPTGTNSFKNMYVREIDSRAKDGANIENILNFSEQYSGKRTWTPLMAKKYWQNLTNKAAERDKNWYDATGSHNNPFWGDRPAAGAVNKLLYRASLPFVLPGGLMDNPSNEEPEQIKPFLHNKITEAVGDREYVDSAQAVSGQTYHPSGNIVNGIPRKPGEPLGAWLLRARRDTTAAHERGHAASFPYLYRNAQEYTLDKIHAGLRKLIPGYVQYDYQDDAPSVSGYAMSSAPELLRGFNVYKAAMIADPYIKSMPDKFIGDKSGGWARRWLQHSRVPEQVDDHELLSHRFGVIQQHADQYLQDVSTGKRSRDIEIDTAIEHLNSIYRGAHRRPQKQQTQPPWAAKYAKV